MATRPFRVAVTATVEQSYLVDANTPEEAESIAEQMFEDKEEGALTFRFIEATEAIPLDEGALSLGLDVVEEEEVLAA